MCMCASTGHAGLPDAKQRAVLVQWYIADRTRLTGFEVPHDTRPTDCTSSHMISLHSAGVPR